MNTSIRSLLMTLATAFPLALIADGDARQKPETHRPQKIDLVAPTSNSTLQFKPLAGPSGTGLLRNFWIKPQNAAQVSTSGLASLTNQIIALQPGVYETAPYCCIVVVPGNHPDDSAVKKVPPEPMEKMPVIKPDLEFRRMALSPASPPRR